MDEAYFRLKSLKYVPDYRRIIRSKEEFKDSQFKADSTSIFSSSNSSFSPEVTSRCKLKMEWRRIKNIYKNEEITIVKDVSPNDVKQGQIGDCYFMSSLTSIALQQPSEIEKLFITKEFNESGIYAMNLLVNGCYQVVVVDDYVPYDVISKDLIFAGKKTKNIWAILLEKAWAKINGCYCILRK